MTGFPINPSFWRGRLAALLLALPLASSPAAAQEGAGATGQPRVLIPNTSAQTPRTVVPVTPGRPVLRERSEVLVGELGTVEGPVAGTLEEGEGGLGYDEWSGSNRAEVEPLLRRLDVASVSPVVRKLVRQLLLSAAPPPQGQGNGSFNALRLRKLLEGGYVADAGELAARMSSREEDIQRAQADALLYAGRDEDLCGDATSLRMERGDAFWIQLRAYCYLVVGETGAFELTRAVMTQRGIADPVFDALIARLADPEADFDEENIPANEMPDALQLRLMVRLDLPLPASSANMLALPVSLLAAASASTDPAVRRAAAERALRDGALAPEVLGTVLDLTVFEPGALDGAVAIARGEPLMDALARLRAALAQESRNDNRAEIVYAAFQIGENENLLPQIAALFAEEAASVMPSADWSNWSPLMARGLMLAGRIEAASRWADLLDPLATGTTGASNRLRIALALAEPNGLHIIQAQNALSSLAFEVTQFDVIPATLARSGLLLGLYEASGAPMPPDATVDIDALLSIEVPGRRPPPVTMERIEEAALAGRRGELVLNVIDAIGPRGLGDLAPDVTVDLVRALRIARIDDSADALSLEAILVRPGAG